MNVRSPFAKEDHPPPAPLHLRQPQPPFHHISDLILERVALESRRYVLHLPSVRYYPSGYIGKPPFPQIMHSKMTIYLFPRFRLLLYLRGIHDGCFPRGPPEHKCEASYPFFSPRPADLPLGLHSVFRSVKFLLLSHFNLQSSTSDCPPFLFSPQTQFPPLHF